MNSPNLELLIRAAEALGEVKERVVFVGGCATALLITDTATASVRVTEDVDVIAAVVSLVEYHRLGNDLRKRGFTQTLEQGEPLYRWTFAGLKLDLMPVDERVLGFSNRWYADAMRTAVTINLREGLHIRLVAPAYFVATKLVAFLDRGKGDYLESHDLEDVISVVDGRPELVEELARADAELQGYVAATFAALLADDGFLDVLPGLVVETSSDRSEVVLERLRTIAGMNEAS